MGENQRNGSEKKNLSIRRMWLQIKNVDWMFRLRSTDQAWLTCRVMVIPELQSFFLSPMLLAAAARVSSWSHQLKPLPASRSYSFWFPKQLPGQGSANYDPTQSQYFGKAENTQYLALYRRSWLTPDLIHQILQIQICSATVNSMNPVIQFLEVIARVLFNRREKLYPRSVFKSLFLIEKMRIEVPSSRGGPCPLCEAFPYHPRSLAPQQPHSCHTSQHLTVYSPLRKQHLLWF